jgi:acetyl-CoA C-acetyltransferase
MSDIAQKLQRRRKDVYAETEPYGFGQRRADFSGMGRTTGNQYGKQREVVCVEACRTPYGRLGGGLKQYDAPELGAMAIQEVLRRTDGAVAPQDVDYVAMGQVVTAGCGQVPGRQAAVLAGLPENVPAITVNKVCSSGIKTVDLAVQMILLGRAEIAVAGGQESMTNCPYALPQMRFGQRMAMPDAQVFDLMVHDGLWDPFYDRHMALHGSETSDEFGYTRQDNDEWALRSQQSAARAMEEGRLEGEVFPVEIASGKKTDVLSRDEQPRPETTLEALAKLPPVFNHTSRVTGQAGSITAGNAPGVNDGGDVCLMMSREKAEEIGAEPLFRVIDYAEVSQQTKDIATVPGLAIAKVLQQNGMGIDEVDLIEINEAFSAVTLISARSILGLTQEQMEAKVNVNGGAIAYGHPIGATGARIVMTLAYELKRRGGGIGVCGICSGLAQGDAMLIRVDG